MRHNPIVYLFSKLWAFSKATGNKNNLILYFVLFTVANCLDLISPLILAKLFDAVQNEVITYDNFGKIIFLVLLPTVIMGAIFWSFHGPARVIETGNAFKVRAAYKEYLVNGVVALPIDWHSNHHTGDTIDKLEKGTNALFGCSEESFEIIQLFIRLIGSYLILAFFNSHAAYIVPVMIAMIIWVIVCFDKILIRNYHSLNRAENGISEKIHDVVNNINTIIILRIEKYVCESIRKKIAGPYGLFYRNSKINETKWFMVSFLGNVMRAVVLIVYLFSSIGTPEIRSAANLLILWNYLNNIRELFFNFARMYGNIIQRKTKIMNSEELAADFTDTAPQNGPKLKNWGLIEVKKLNFSYQTKEGADLHLDDISLTIKKGERIALIGESGSGKSTLLKIMMDLYHPIDIEIVKDGKSIGGFSEISRDIALVPQDPEIFSTTIFENIAPGNGSDTDKVVKFSNMAMFTEIAERLPKKFHSSVKEKGVNLSGGEKQRLALARGLLAAEMKEIVLLDEPTSSIDTPTEFLIYQNIFRAFPGKTIISSIHRLHLLPMFDTIYFFDEGKIIASGNFAELLENSSEFREIWNRYQKMIYD